MDWCLFLAFLFLFKKWPQQCWITSLSLCSEMLGFFLVEIPRKRGSKTSKLFFFFFFTFSFLFYFLFFNVFAPLRTFDDFVALKRGFAVLTWILLTTGKSFVQMTHTHTHVYARTHAQRMLFNFFYGNFTLNAQIILYLKEPISIEITSKYNILNAKKPNKYVKSVWLGCFNLFCTIKLWNILA